MKKILLLGSMLFYFHFLTIAQVGYNNTPSNVNNSSPYFSSALGSGNTSTGNNSFAAGLNATAKGNQSFSLGNKIQATAENSFIIGSGSDGLFAKSFVNTFSNSLMIGFNSPGIPSLFIEPFSSDQNKGFVGIHTTSPRSTLDVKGTLTANGFVFTENPTIGHVLTCVDANGTVAWQAPEGGISSGTNNYVNGVSFSTSNGILTLNRYGLSDLSVDLDGRYLSSVSWANVSSGHTAATHNGLNIISSQSNYLSSGLLASDELLVNDGGNVKRMDVSVLETYMQNNLDFGTGGSLPAEGYWENEENTSNIFRFDGNVGIGNRSPQYRLDVSGTIRVNDFILNGVGVAGNVLTRASDGTAYWSSIQSSTSVWNENLNGIYYNDLNVGIGTSSPVEKLHVAGTILAEDGIRLFGLNNYLVFGDEINSIFQIARNGSSKGTQPDPLGSPDEILFTIDANNNFGIGIDQPAPDAKLDVDGSIRTNGELVFAPGQDGIIRYGSPVEGQTLKFLSNYIDGLKGSITGLAITSLGDVGIGTDSPGAKLQVKGKTKTVDFQMTAGSDVQNYILTSSDNFGNATWTNPADIISSGVWEVTNGIAHYEGKVGINTTYVPEFVDFAVNGSIICNKIEVKIESEWPDFVFEEDYQLQSLTEIESFVKENKHLPGVPSAEEIKENGQDLGEMNTILLQKIEELTLLMIAQQKEIDALKKLVNQ